ncbi:DUF7331 family protein [Halosimplex salinum]|uniref:DUF7331 family protein n=1 Tax=Halosimplex salinum TaxID=1710538 RepID=UPI000F496AA0|nr:hypothetical protein [Halosimplex salinum]
MEATDESGTRAEAQDGADAAPDAACPNISAYSTTETRTVFTESDNGDGWIATDLTVEIRE